MERRESFCPGVMVWVVVGVLCGVALAQYGGGSGTADDPYLIYTAEEMNAIGADPNDWDKHFLLMADIDLSGYMYDSFNLIGTGRYASRIRRPRPRVDSLATTSGGPFRGVFDGGGHTIANFSYGGWAEEETIGLFMYVDDPNAVIKNLGLIAPNIDARSGRCVGSLVGSLFSGTITNCYARGGAVVGGETVGGLIGAGGEYWESALGTISGCYADVTVMGDRWVGGLVGSGGGTLVNCYASGDVVGNEYVGGLVGSSGGAIENCYAAGAVVGERYVGGLAGGEYPTDAVASFWDVQASRQQTSMGGEGKTTSQMQMLLTFRAWGEGDSAGVWTIDDGEDYPRLAWEHRGGVVIEALESDDLPAGAGTADDPYLIRTVDELALAASDPNEWGRHFKLMADIDLSAHPGVGFTLGWGGPNSRPFTGVFDGNAHTISNFTYVSDEWRSAGFFGYVENCCTPSIRGGMECDPNTTGAAIMNLGLVNPVVDGRPGHFAGALVGCLYSGTVRNCYVEGGLVLGGYEEIGGLVGASSGTVQGCYVAGGTVMGNSSVGGLLGSNGGDVTNCYSTNTAIGERNVGGLVGINAGVASIMSCHATGRVIGTMQVGGLIGTNWEGSVTAGFWDVETTGQATSDGGTGLRTAEMMAAGAFLAAGWDFVGEVENGTEDVWWIDDGQGYPRLWWEVGAEGSL